MLRFQSIFLADDDTDDIEIFQYALKDVHPQCTLTVALNGVDLLEKLNLTTALPDLVFVDINMPLLNGFETLQKIKADERLKDIPVIFYSTSFEQPDRKKAYELGADHYLMKPNDVKVLKHIIKDLLEKDWKSEFTFTEV